MPLDPDKIFALPPLEIDHSYTARDTIIYALGIGAEDLPFVYEEGLQALPMMANVITYPGFVWREPRWGVTWNKILHAEQSIELFKPLPPEGKMHGVQIIDDIIDKGAEKGAIILLTRKIYDGKGGDHIANVKTTTFMRGDGGFGGKSDGAPAPFTLPERAPDISVTLNTATNIAMIYRLSGDVNPLHIDPAVAQGAGFPRPILHGLATYGVVGRTLLSALCNNDCARLTRMDARFSSPVYPGETIATDIWNVDKGTAGFRARVVERDLVVINNGYVEFAG